MSSTSNNNNNNNNNPFALSSGDKKEVLELIKRALAEDLHEVGDLTTQATVAPHLRAKGRFLAKAEGVVAGIEVAEVVFQQVDPALKATWTNKDGDYIKKGTYFGEVEGPANALLIAERLVLNLMQRMSGIATATKKMVDAAGGPQAKTKILDTRKTAPGLRVLDKLAVKIGGGTNHRIGLFDMVMIKDNHVTAAGGIKNAITATRKYLTDKNLLGQVQIEVETRTLEEVKEVLEIGGVDRVMLDNMVKVSDDGKVDTSMLQSALSLIKGRFATEASGNVTLNTVPSIAATGVDYISSGSLTHSVTALDISLKIQLLSSM